MIDLRHPNGDAFVFDDGQRMTFEELSREVLRRTSGATEAGIVALEAAPTPGFLASFLGALETGRPVALFCPHWTDEEKRARHEILRAGAHPEAAVILFTSGSTGRPKAVQLSRRNIEANTRAVLASLDFEKAPAQHLFLPLYYSYGLMGHVLPALAAGVRTFLYRDFRSAALAFRQGGCAGMWSGVPSNWEALLKLAPDESERRKVTHVVSAGAPFPVPLRERLRDAFPEAVLFNNYGLTEASPRMLSYSSAHPDFFDEYAGFAVGDFEIKTLGDGELAGRGSQVMLGYLGDEAGTAERIQEGWLRTGDTARIRADGLVSIEGRKDDLVNIGGERTSPQEIERALRALAGIEEALVQFDEDPLYGLVPVAVLTFREGSALSRKQVLEGLRPLLSANKTPREFFAVKEFPRLPNGKFDRQAVRLIRDPALRLK